MAKRSLDKGLQKAIAQVCTELGLSFSFDAKNSVCGFTHPKQGYLEATVLDYGVTEENCANNFTSYAYLSISLTYFCRDEYTSYYENDGLWIANEPVNDDWNCDRRRVRFVAHLDMDINYCKKWDRQWRLEMLEQTLRDIFKIRQSKKQSA